MVEKKFDYRYLLLLILILGLILRVYHINYPFSGHISIKETDYAGMAKMMMEEGKYFTPRGYFLPPHNNVFFPAWIVIGSWTFFGQSELAARIPFVIMGLLSIILVFLIGKELSNKNIGLIAAFFMAVSPMMAYFSRNVQGECPLIFFSLLSIYFFIMFKKNNNFLLLISSGFFLLLATMSKLTMLYLLFFYFLYYLKYRNEFKISFLKTSTFLAIPIIPTLIYIIYSSSLAHCYGAESFIPSVALFNLKGIIYRIIYLVGYVNLIVFLLFLLFIYYIIKHKKIKEFDYVVIIWFFSYLLCYMAVFNKASIGNIYYLISFIPPILLGASKVFNIFLEKWRFEFNALIIIAIILTSFLTLFVLYDIQYPYPEAGLALSKIIKEGDTIYRIGDGSVCYYAGHFCSQHSGYEDDAKVTGYLYKGYDYLSIFGGELDDLLEDPDAKEFLENNYNLLTKIEGKANLFSGRFMSYNKPPYEYIYINKNIKKPS